MLNSRLSFVFGISVVVVVSSCLGSTPGRDGSIILYSAQPLQAGPVQSVNASECITVFFTGNELGQMQPCGCSGGQLGGLDRRFTVFNTVSPKDRVIFDTGSLVPESTEQNLIKFNVIVQAYSQLGYDVVNLTKQDIFIARQAGLFEALGGLFNCMTPEVADDVNLPARYAKRFTLNGSIVDVAVAVADTNEQILDVAKALPAENANSSGMVAILIISRPDAVSVAAATGAFDCLIGPPRSDEPMLIGDANARPLVISVGRLGKYVGKIQVALTAGSQKPRLSFSAVPVDGNLQPVQTLVELYKDYQRLVKEAGLLEKFPRFVLPDNLEYVGSRSCKLCHDYEYEKWMTSGQVCIPGLEKQASPDSRHSDAFATLEKVNSHYDPECVICHVVGMQYITGFVSPTTTPDLKDVGCENCHGPGSEHIRSLGAAETSGPISVCTDCHTTERSTEYAAYQQQYFEKTIHWREPASRIRVTEP
jgi:hypothetical protein